MTVAPNVRVEAESETTGATPVPLSEITCGLFEALSVNVKVALAAPIAEGVKVTETAQVALAARLAPAQVSEATANSEAFAPPRTTLEMVSAILPVLVTVRVWAELAVPTNWLPKLRLDADAEKTAAVPAPLRETLWGLLAESAVTWSEPATVPMAEGVKVTPMEQLALAASVAPQVVLETAKALRLVETLMLPSVPVPVLVRVTVCAALVVPTF